MTYVRPFLQAHEWHPHKKLNNNGQYRHFRSHSSIDPTRKAFRKERLFCCHKMRLTVRRISLGFLFFHYAAGVELAERLLGDRYEAVVSTHLDREHLHCHIVFNSVSFLDGR